MKGSKVGQMMALTVIPTEQTNCDLSSGHQLNTGL